MRRLSLLLTLLTSSLLLAADIPEKYCGNWLLVNGTLVLSIAADALRTGIIAEASPILEKALQNWKYAPKYKVEIVVSALYWTDASVGRPAPRSRGWF